MFKFYIKIMNEPHLVVSISDIQQNCYYPKRTFYLKVLLDQKITIAPKSNRILGQRFENILKKLH